MSSLQSVKDKDVEYDEIIHLSDAVKVFPNRPLASHGNVFYGIYKSDVYGDRPCAIKYARLSEQNIREAEILTKLGFHENVISLIQSGIDKQSFIEKVYLALEKCNDLNFRQYLMKHKKEVPIFDLNWGFVYCKQIISGMTHIHEKLVIHRDLKPSNILLSQDFSIIKIADFGSSMTVKSTNSMLRFNNAFGTHGYRPPEGLGQPESFGSLKSDVYSLGLLFYFILSFGESPLGNDSTKWDINTREGILDLSNLLIPNPKAVKHLLSLMLSRERCRRPSMWQIAEHDCWSEEEVDCSFDYGYTEETLESEAVETGSSSEKSSDSENENDEIALKFIIENRLIYRKIHGKDKSIADDDDDPTPSKSSTYKIQSKPKESATSSKFFGDGFNNDVTMAPAPMEMLGLEEDSEEDPSYFDESEIDDSEEDSALKKGAPAKDEWTEHDYERVLIAQEQLKRYHSCDSSEIHAVGRSNKGDDDVSLPKSSTSQILPETQGQTCSSNSSFGGASRELFEAAKMRKEEAKNGKEEFRTTKAFIESRLWDRATKAFIESRLWDRALMEMLDSDEDSEEDPKKRVLYQARMLQMLEKHRRRIRRTEEARIGKEEFPIPMLMLEDWEEDSEEDPNEGEEEEKEEGNQQQQEDQREQQLRPKRNHEKDPV